MTSSSVYRQLSTVIIAQNEEECIANAIQSCLSFADEIIVVDGGSQDQTVKIAQTLGCQVYHNPWPGYAKQRNFGADCSSFDWIFCLDADEVVDPKLQAAILEWKQTPKLAADAFSIRRVGDFFEKWLDTRAESHIRLYNKTLFRVKEVLVHEQPDVGDAPVIQLPGTLWHQGFRGMSDLVIRFNRYTDLDAQQAYLLGKRFNWWRFLLKPPAKFLQQYLWYGMYRQGLAGLALSILWSYYIFLKEIKIYELAWKSQRSHQTPNYSQVPVTSSVT
jgi:glycosyltransferase involved in cell wall biosynthesis